MCQQSGSPQAAFRENRSGMVLYPFASLAIPDAKKEVTIMAWAYDTYVFDFYGTLADIRTDEEDPRVWEAFCWELRLRGMDWTPERLKAQYLRLCEENLAEKEAELQKRGLSGPAEADIRQVFLALGKAGGKALSHGEADGVARLFRALTLKKLRLFEGADALLAALGKGRRQVILLTNAQSAFTVPELEYLGIGRRFHQIIISGDHGVRKPSPAFFDLLTAAGVDKRRALMIGNDDACDCHGAAQWGMDSLYIRTEQSPPLSGPLPGNCRPIGSLSAVR